MPGVKMVEALAQCGAVAVLSQPENEGKLVLFAGIDDVRFKRIVRPGEVLDLLCEVEAVRGPVGKGKVRASVGGELAVRGTLTFAVSGGMIAPRNRHGPSRSRGSAATCPSSVVTNDELAKVVDTSDEWIATRTGIRERRIAADDEAMSDISLPAARAALAQAGLEGEDIDLIIVATITPDMAFPATAGIVADQLGSVDAAAYDLSAGCTGLHVRARAGPRRRSRPGSRSARS